MSEFEFVFEGLAELIEDMRRLPETMSGEVSNIVEASANQAVLAIKSAYPAKLGDVRDKVESSLNSTPYGTTATIKNTHKLASIFEKGTEARHYVTVNGVQHATGRIAPVHAFIPQMARTRRSMYAKFKDVLVRIGLEVSEDGL